MVLFDLDGTLVDSEDGELQALVDLCADFGHHLSADTASDLFRGARLADSLAVCARLVGDNRVLRRARWVRTRCEQLLEGRVSAVPGAYDLVVNLSVDCRVVSNSPLEIIERRLWQAGLADILPGPHYSAYSYNRWKPDPGIYLAALKAERRSASEVVAVEDSAVGATAAVSAGLRTVFFGPSSGVAVWREIATLSELRPILDAA